MSNPKARWVVILATLLGAGVLFVVGSIAWDLHTWTYTVTAEPDALAHDARVIQLATESIKRHGANPSEFTLLQSHEGGPWIGRSEPYSHRVNVIWVARAPNTPGLSVTFEPQEHGDLLCSIGKTK